MVAYLSNETNRRLQTSGKLEIGYKQWLSNPFFGKLLVPNESGRQSKLLWK